MMEMTGATKTPAHAAPAASAASLHPKFFVFHLCVDSVARSKVGVAVANSDSLVTFMMAKASP